MQQWQGYTPLGKTQNKIFKAMKVAGTCAAVLAVSLLLVACLQSVAPIGQALLNQYTDARQPDQSNSMQDLCSKLSGSVQQLCNKYASAVKEDAWDAAAAWRRASPESCKRLQTEQYIFHPQALPLRTCLQHISLHRTLFK
jgi:hypothetical protein